MSTIPNPGGNPLAADRDDPPAAALQAAILRARVRDTTVRLSLAMFRARGYAELWGMEADARSWASNAESIRTDLAELNDQLVALASEEPTGEAAADGTATPSAPTSVSPGAQVRSARRSLASAGM